MKIDLLAPRAARTISLWAGFPLIFQVLTLLVLGALIAAGLGVKRDVTPAELLILRKTNLATLAVWGLWWPAMIVAATLVGRLWCTVCPLELVNRLGETLGRCFGMPRAPLPKTLRAGWLILLSYFALHLMVAGISIHRAPYDTAVLLVALVCLALATGLVFREPRSFCTAFCPAAALLSVYGRFTPLQLDVRKPSVCSRCSTKNCVAIPNRDRFDKPGCPSLLRPFRRSASDGCVLCFRCAKACPHANVGFGLVSKHAPVRRKNLLRPFEAVFAMSALGFVSHELIGEVEWLDALFHRPALALARMIPALSFRWVEALWFLILFPLTVWSLVAVVAYGAGHRAGLRSLLLAAATGAAPLIAVGHGAKALAKLSAWAGFFPLAMSDPLGVETLHNISAHRLQAPAKLLNLSVLGWIMLSLAIPAAWIAWTWARHLPRNAVPAARAGVASAALLLSVVLTIWGWSAG